MANLDEVADDLYGGPPAEFVARRDGAAKAARAEGDRVLAKEIASLRRPTVSAWLVNLLMRDDPDLGAQVVALGEGLRDAERSLDGPALRELTAQRRALVRSLVDRARRLAGPSGQKIGDAVTQELDATLTAALADPATAAQVVSGRLTEARSWSGFGVAGVDEPPARPHLRLVGSDDRAGRGGAASPASGAPADGMDDVGSVGAGRTKEDGSQPREHVQSEAAQRRADKARDDRERREAKEREAAARLARAEAQEAWEEAERQVRALGERHAAAVRGRDGHAADLERAEEAAGDAHGEEDRLVRELADVRRRLAAAGDEASAADRTVREAQRALRDDERDAETAERDLRRAERARDTAAAARDRLTDGG